MSYGWASNEVVEICGIALQVFFMSGVLVCIAVVAGITILCVSWCRGWVICAVCSRNEQ